MTEQKKTPPPGKAGASHVAQNNRTANKASTPPSAGADKRPFIETSPDLHVLAEACELALAKDARVFVRAGKLGRLIRPKEGAELCWHPFGLAALRRTVGEHARFFTWTSRGGAEAERKPVKVPEDAAEAMRQQGAWRHLRHLHRIVRSPFLRADGTLCQVPGYDTASGMFGDFAKGDFPKVPERPTQADAAKALRELASTFRDFPFDGCVFRRGPIIGSGVTRSGIPVPDRWFRRNPIRDSGARSLVPA